MKKMISALAIAGMSAALAVGANAQTVSSSTPGVYMVNIAASATPGTDVNGILTGPGYNYSYVATLAGTSPGVSVNTFAFGFPGSGEYDPTSASSSGSGFLPGQEQDNLLTFTSPTGLTTVGDKTTLGFFSTLPPDGLVNITPSASAPNGTGGGLGSPVIGPGTAVPEPGSFALLGLGLLPLGFIARRRMASSL